MTILIFGLICFFSTHFVRIVADDWRSAQIARIGEKRWKALYSLVSALGLGLIVWGFVLSRQAPIMIWQPMSWTRHLTILLSLPAFILVTAAYVPGNRIKAKLGHPMVLGVKVWALAHLVSNGRLDEILLFGTFLVWAVLAFRSERARDRANHVAYRPGSLAGDAKVLVAGLLGWAIFAKYLHVLLIGVNPLIFINI